VVGHHTMPQAVPQQLEQVLHLNNLINAHIEQP
jgi:hypothetical protein